MDGSAPEVASPARLSRQRKRKWGGLEASYPGSHLPQDADLTQFAAEENFRKGDVSRFIQAQDIFPGRAPGSGYDWQLHSRNVKRRLNACSLVVALAYLQAKPPLRAIPAGNWYCCACASRWQGAASPPSQELDRGLHARGALPASRLLMRADARLPQLSPAEGAVGGAGAAGRSSALQRAREDVASAFAQIDGPRRVQPRYQQPPLRALVMPPPAQVEGPGHSSPSLPIAANEAVTDQREDDAMPTIPLSTPGLSHVLQIRKAPPAATIQKLIEECHATLIAKRGCDVDITRVLALFGLDYLMAAGGRQGTVDGAASLPIRLDILLKDLTLKCDNTWGQYWPKIDNLVVWLNHNAAVNSGEDTLITEGKFLQFVKDISDGTCTTHGGRERVKRGVTPAEVQAMGVSTAKQYLAAVALLQRFQHTLLHGDLVGVPITRAACVKLTLSHVRKHENTRRQTSMVDAAANAPTLIEESQHMSLLESHLVKDNKRAYVAGMRDVAMHNHAMSTMGRQLRGTAMSINVHWGQWPCGTSQNITWRSYQCPTFLGGKAGWYKNLVFSVGNLDTAYQPAHQYEQVRAAQTRAGIRKNGVAGTAVAADPSRAVNAVGERSAILPQEALAILQRMEARQQDLCQEVRRVKADMSGHRAEQCTRGGADDPEAAVMEPAEELWEPWTDWDGHHHSLTLCSLLDIYNDGTRGILLVPASEHRAELRTHSLMELEARYRGVNGEPFKWRAGPKMRKQVLNRKTLLYALQRRIESAAASSPADKLQSALDQLKTMREQVSARLAAASRSTAAQRSRRAKECSLLQLVDHLLEQEMKPAEYEATALLWPQISMMPHGNPMERHATAAAGGSARD
ncbi:hypothetical protein WJX75_008380 [Coccomyxa subellipsoidea]|uniref:Ndc10 domain-containing protein n=1 Tax=Coccomyxa subellipsoidea TaxID=248742 RepID=A0ABR2Z4U1_9CHLO